MKKRLLLGMTQISKNQLLHIVIELPICISPHASLQYHTRWSCCVFNLDKKLGNLP